MTTNVNNTNKYHDFIYFCLCKSQHIYIYLYSLYLLLLLCIVTHTIVDFIKSIDLYIYIFISEVYQRIPSKLWPRYAYIT